MSLVSSLTPVNLTEEKEKFLSDFSYNPQFVYEEPATTKQLKEYGLPEAKYLDLANEIVKKSYFGRNFADLRLNEGKLVTEDEVNEKIQTFLHMHHLQERFQVVWSSSFVSRATITSDTLKLRQNAEFRQEGLLSMIYHELGTHALRRVNYEQQPWFKKRKKFGLIHKYLPTEEGLATLHSLLPKSFQLAYFVALRYLAIEYAQDHSFAQLWKFISHYVQDEEMLWMICFRSKRGLSDTSEGGGLTKDMIYFEGAIKVWKWLAKHDYNITNLYYGKLAVEDVNRAIELNPEFEPLLPSFFVLDRERYAKKIEAIGLDNLFDQI